MSLVWIRHNATFGSRLLAAGVSDRDLKDLLGHKSRDITDHYTAPMIQNLIMAVEKVCNRNGLSTVAVLLKRHKELREGNLAARSHQFPTRLNKVKDDVEIGSESVDAYSL